MLTGLISLFTKDPKQKLADEFIKFVETGDNELLKNYQIQIGSKKFNQDGNGYLNFILKNKATKEKEHFSVGITPFLCNQESGNYGQVFACIREKQNGKHTNIKTYEVTDKMYKRIQKLISNVTSSRDSRFQNIEDFAETYLPLDDKYVYPIAPAPLTFDVKNGTATWINRQTNKTMGERPTLSGIEPTAVSVEESTAGMSTVAIASLATLGGLGFFIAAGAVAYCLWHREKRTTGYSVSDLPSSPEKQSFLLEGGSSAEETVVTLAVEGSEVTDSLLPTNGEPVGENAPTRLPRAEPKPLETIPEEEGPCGAGSISSAKGLYDHAFDALRRSIHQVISVLNHAQPQTENLESPKSSISGSRTSVHSNSTGVSEGNSFHI